MAICAPAPRRASIKNGVTRCAFSLLPFAATSPMGHFARRSRATRSKSQSRFWSSISAHRALNERLDVIIYRAREPSHSLLQNYSYSVAIISLIISSRRLSSLYRFTVRHLAISLLSSHFSYPCSPHANPAIWTFISFSLYSLSLSVNWIDIVSYL